MSSLAEEVLDRLRRELEAGGPSSTNEWREEITRAHEAATTEAERVLCLDMFKFVSGILERRIAERPLSPEDLPQFQKLRRQYYNALLLQEAAIGCTDGTIPPDKLAAITRREVAAGRMPPDDEMHQLAVELAGDERSTTRMLGRSGRQVPPCNELCKDVSAFANSAGGKLSMELKSKVLRTFYRIGDVLEPDQHGGRARCWT